MLKKILLALIFVITAITNVTHAEDDMKTVASKAYVDTKIETKQLKIPAANTPGVGAGETVMTYTTNGDGEIGERGLYSDISSYDATADGDKLITASALNATFTNLPTTPTTKLECANQADGCTLWTIVDQTAYARGLPAEYTRLEYIQSTGTQYIDTGVILNSEATITTVGQNLQDVGASSGPYSFRGFMGAPSNVPRWGWSVYNGRWLAELNTTMSTGAPYDKNKHTFVNTCYYDSRDVLVYDSLVDGVKIYNWQNVTNVAAYTSNTLSAYLFARNNNNTAGNFLSCRIFSYEIVQDGVKVLNLVPCRRNSDSELGMYDLVSGQFLTNQGTGDFTPGPVAN